MSNANAQQILASRGREPKTRMLQLRPSAAVGDLCGEWAGDDTHTHTDAQMDPSAGANTINGQSPTLFL